jgi:hypothetical protein
MPSRIVGGGDECENAYTGVAVIRERPIRLSTARGRCLETAYSHHWGDEALKVAAESLVLKPERVKVVGAENLINWSI